MKTTAIKLPLRQGDIILIPIAKSDTPVDPAPTDPRGVVLAEGETSGHFHALVGGKGKLFRFRDSAREEMLLRVTSGSSLEVIGGEVAGKRRHEPLKLPKGDYLVRPQRTWTAASARSQSTLFTEHFRSRRISKLALSVPSRKSPSPSSLAKSPERCSARKSAKQ